MKIFSLIKKNSYFDSVTLMGISKRLGELAGVFNVSVSMGTELNQSLLRDSKMNTLETDEATPNDLMITFQLEEEGNADSVFDAVEKALVKRSGSSASKSKPVGMKSALDVLPDANMVVISLPGEYAAFEARKALQNDLHVMVFSDNVSIEDELMLKTLAHEKGLLLMGPDCGTAIINQKALCFANVVSKGRVGVIGASGTGTQEVTVLLDQYGLGVSQVIGTGGRDLSKTINAVIRSLEVLGEATKHIPASFRTKHPDIPWSKMAGMRDVLIHDYMGVDLMTVWKVAKERLPEIKMLVKVLVGNGN